MDESMPQHRRNYAVQILAVAGVASDPALFEAFSAVPREAFVGPPPWSMSIVGGGYRPLASQDPIVLYQDILIGLDPARMVNNGSPSLHAGALHRLGVKPGDSIVHVGCGTGYYTAILAHLIGNAGHVTAIEFDDALAAQATANLAGHANVTVLQGDGLRMPLPQADIVYVNFAVDHPVEGWVEALKPGGRLLFPFGYPDRSADGAAAAKTHRAGFLLVERDAAGLAARFIQPVFFVWVDGSERNETRWEALRAAFSTGAAKNVRRLRWKTTATSEEWYGEDGWGLAFA